MRHLPLFAAIALTWSVAAPVEAQTDGVPQERPSSVMPNGLLRGALFGPRFAADQVVPQPAGPPPTPRHTGIKAMVKELGRDVKELPSRENLIWVGIGSGLALAAHPFDEDVNRRIISSDLLRRSLHPARSWGSYRRC